MIKYIIALFLILGCGCSTSKNNWAPDSVYVENSTYDNGEHTYHEAGISGEIGETGVRLDVFGVVSPSTNGDRDHYYGGGFRLDIPLK